MTYLQDKKRKQQKTLFVVLSVCLVLTMFIGVGKLLGFLRPLSSSTVSTTNSLAQDSSTSLLKAFTTKEELYNEILRLEEEIKNLKNQETKYTLQENELVELRSLLGVKENNILSKGVLRRVSEVSIYGTFYVEGDAPKKVGSQILNKEGYLVGTISDTSNGRAQVIHVDSYKETLKAEVLDEETNFDLTKSGRGVLIAKVPQDTEVEMGSLVVVPYKGTKIPLGRIISETSDEKNPYKEVYVRVGSNPKVDYQYLVVE
jgi:cell shape-determining protein MreC